MLHLSQMWQQHSCTSVCKVNFKPAVTAAGKKSKEASLMYVKKLHLLNALHNYTSFQGCQCQGSTEFITAHQND
jgi:hypothetical protein